MALAEARRKSHESHAARANKKNAKERAWHYFAVLEAAKMLSANPTLKRTSLHNALAAAENARRKPSKRKIKEAAVEKMLRENKELLRELIDIHHRAQIARE